MRPLSYVETLVLLSTLAYTQAPAVGDYTKLATQGDYVVRDFKFHTGETGFRCSSLLAISPARLPKRFVIRYMLALAFAVSSRTIAS